jgi:hypothetical protein
VIGIIAAVVVIGLAGAAWWLWTNRNYVLYEHAEQLPEAVREKIPEQQVELDLHRLSRGLGAELVIGGSYHDLLAATRDWQPEWKVAQLGSGHLRVTSSGVEVYTVGETISTYELELPVIFADPRWQPWIAELRAAHVEPELSWTVVSGEPELPEGSTEKVYQGSRRIRIGDSYAEPVFTLYFYDGYLKRVVGGVDYGEQVEEDG